MEIFCGNHLAIFGQKNRFEIISRNIDREVKGVN